MGLYLQETAVNTDLNYIIGETDVYETFTDERGELFRSCQREYGRCTGRWGGCSRGWRATRTPASRTTKRRG